MHAEFLYIFILGMWIWTQAAEIWHLLQSGGDDLDLSLQGMPVVPNSWGDGVDFRHLFIIPYHEGHAF